MRYLFGEWTSSENALTDFEIQKLILHGQEQAQAMAIYPTDRIYTVLEDLSLLWADKNYIGRKQTLELLPQETGFSPEMIELALDQLPKLLNPRSLQKKIQTELYGLPPVGEEHYRFETQTGLSWQPLGLILHVLAGNVFLGGPGSWLEGLITKNANILKMSSGEKIFLPLFIRSLQQVDSDGVISKSIALVDYSSSDQAVIEKIKAAVDGIVVWGGEQAVKAYRKDLSLQTRLIAFGPKLSFAMITKQALSLESIPQIAEDLATDISIWDQSACTAPQMVYVQDKELLHPLAQALGSALAAKAKVLPAGPADLDTAVEIRKMRTVAEIAAARELGFLSASENNLDYTVIVDQQRALTASPLHRTIRLVAVEKLNEIYHEMKKIKGFLQSVGLKCDLSEQMEIHHQLARNGATRIVDFGSMASSEIDDPHDGQYDLSQFVHFITQRLKKPASVTTLADITGPSNFKTILDQRFRHLISQTQPKEIRDQIKGLDDISKLPIMTATSSQAQLELYKPIGGYVTRSGGSTGEPKYSIYDGPDWERMISSAVSVFHAMGLRRGDRVANCFMAGDLYGSFVSFDHINVRVGLLTFGFAGQVNAEFFVQTYRKVGFNVVQGVPAKILPLLREALALEPSLRIEKVIYAGAPMAEPDREWLRTELGVQRIASVIGANDGGQFAFQCAFQTGRIHHIVDDFNYIEIVDEKGKPVEQDQAGRILITSLLKYNYPLIRYEIGDRGRFVPSKCQCGSQRRVIEYLGRDDVYSVGMMNFSFADCQKALSSYPTSDLQVHIKTSKGKDLLMIQVESSKKDPNFSAELKAGLLDQMGKLKERYLLGALDFEVTVLPIGALPRDPRSGKIKQVVDERI